VKMSVIYIHDTASSNSGDSGELLTRDLQQQQHAHSQSQSQQAQQSQQQQAAAAPFNRPALQVVGLEDSLDVDDKMEHTQHPNPNTFQEQSSNASNAEQMAYVQRCLLQLKDRMQQQQRDSESRGRGQATPTPSEDLAYAVQTSMLNKHVRNALQKERDQQQKQYLQEEADKQRKEQRQRDKESREQERRDRATREQQQEQEQKQEQKQRSLPSNASTKNRFAFDQQSDIDFDARQARYIMEKAKREEGDLDDNNNQQNNRRDYVDDSDSGNPFESQRLKQHEVIELEETLPKQLDWLGEQLAKYYGSEELGYSSTSSLKDKLDYVYRMLKQREQKKYQAIKTLIPSINSPDDEDTAYDLAFKGAIGAFADKIKREQKQAAKQKNSASSSSSSSAIKSKL